MVVEYVSKETDDDVYMAFTSDGVRKNFILGKNNSFVE